MRPSSALIAVTAALAIPLIARAADPAPVVAAERAFAADGLAMGIKRSFLKHAAPEAIVFAPDAVKAHEYYDARPDKPTPPLVWWPVWAGLSASGDLGFTTGPFTYDGKPGGFYFTIWRRNADGVWKWVYDGGTNSDAADAPGPESEPEALAPATAEKTLTDIAWAGVSEAEDALAKAAEHDTGKAYRAALAPDAHVQGSAAPPAVTPKAVAKELAGRAKRISFSHQGGEVSAAGDLAWTWGDAQWSAKTGPMRGHYVRVWRHDKEGWRLVFDQILDVPPMNS
ncbi:DUF4440 domain-containing protein [Phenylobacterium sp.]|uniref:DUF4440 domain-containing protein n=1 Tax=Phenylobacterium sp. TaxID=1871053 RepID=UPI0035B4CF51